MATPTEKLTEASVEKMDYKQVYLHLINEILPKIEEVSDKCDFLISYGNLTSDYEKFMKSKSETSYFKPAKKVCEYYGCLISQLENVKFWEPNVFKKEEHLDALACYRTFKQIPFDRTLFIVSPDKGQKSK